MNELNIKQIIPAPDNMYVIYKDDDGSTFESKVACLALWGNDEITIMEVDHGGVFHKPATNIVDVIYK